MATFPWRLTEPNTNLEPSSSSHAFPARYSQLLVNGNRHSCHSPHRNHDRALPAASNSIGSGRQRQRRRCFRCCCWWCHRVLLKWQESSKEIRAFSALFSSWVKPKGFERASVANAVIATTLQCPIHGAKYKLLTVVAVVIDLRSVDPVWWAMSSRALNGPSIGPHWVNTKYFRIYYIIYDI